MSTGTCTTRMWSGDRAAPMAPGGATQDSIRRPARTPMEMRRTITWLPSIRSSRPLRHPADGMAGEGPHADEQRLQDQAGVDVAPERRLRLLDRVNGAAEVLRPGASGPFGHVRLTVQIDQEVGILRRLPDYEVAEPPERDLEPPFDLIPLP